MYLYVHLGENLVKKVSTAAFSGIFAIKKPAQFKQIPRWIEWLTYTTTLVVQLVILLKKQS